MRINRNSLSAMAWDIAKENGISANAAYLRYFFDCFLKKLYASSYADKFILKDRLSMLH